MGAAKGTLKPDVTGFRKKGTGNPVLIAKKQGKICLNKNHAKLSSFNVIRLTLNNEFSSWSFILNLIYSYAQFYPLILSFSLWASDWLSL